MLERNGTRCAIAPPVDDDRDRATVQLNFLLEKYYCKMKYFTSMRKENMVEKKEAQKKENRVSMQLNNQY